jgi:hypothetical protein
MINSLNILPIFVKYNKIYEKTLKNTLFSYAPGKGALKPVLLYNIRYGIPETARPRSSPL